MTFIARVVASLVGGWTVAGVLIAVSVRIFSRSSMKVVGPIDLLLGLVVAVVCWRATRSWKPRQATADELSTGFNVHLGYPYLTFFLLISVVSFGTMALPFWIHSRRWPKKLDREGMTLRNGTRLAWREITEIIAGGKRLGGVVVNRWWELRGNGINAMIVPNSLAEGPAVLQFVSRVLGRDLTTG